MQKHTASSLAKKDAMAKAKAGGVGGGAAGAAARQSQQILPKCEYCGMSPASFADMKTHIENKHPKEQFGEAEQEKMKLKYAECKKQTADALRGKSGQMNKKESGGKKEKGAGGKKGTGNTDALPAELLAAMAGMGPKKGAKKKK